MPVCYNKTVERDKSPKGKEGKKMATYWKENRTGIIYKYAFGTKPYRANGNWTEVAAHDYEEQLINATLRYLQRKEG